MIRSFTDDDFALLQARIEAITFELEQIRIKMEDELGNPDIVQQDSGDWNGEFRVAGKLVSDNYEESFTGTKSEYVRLYFDGTTVPSYTTKVEFKSPSWGDQYKIVKLSELYAAFGPYNIDRA